ncbi:hypothetical protein EFN30_03235 [Propionibacterium freudenreichii]|nr:hypothetical protein [Propionibacterium freudenreichii]MCT3002019.1 hypothetical protein [Propionibacterium freudenreichii]
MRGGGSRRLRRTRSHGTRGLGGHRRDRSRRLPGHARCGELADAAPLGDALLADGLELPASPAATFAGDAPKTSTAINTPTTNCTSHDSAKLHQ